MMRRVMSWIVGTVVVVLVTIAAFGMFLRWREPRLLYFPTRAIEWTPDRVGLAYEEVRLVASDGVRLHGWFIPATPRPDLGDALARPGRNASDAPAVTLLFLHGNGGNISHRSEKLVRLHRLRVAVLILDYRGYGNSEGTPDEPGTYRDAEAAWQYLTRERGVPPDRIVIYGESLGSAVAVELATRVRAAGLVLEEAFTSVGDVAQAMFPGMPVRWLVRNRYDSIDKIGRVAVPVLLLHSSDDEYFPLRHAERLLGAAKQPKRLVVLRGGHNDAFMVSGGMYAAALSEFLGQLGVSR